MSLRIRMLIPLLVLALVGMVAAVGQSWRSGQMAAETRDIFDESLMAISTIDRVERNLGIADVELSRVMDMVQLYDFEASLAAFRAAADEVESSIQILRNTAHTDDEKTMAAEIEAARQLWLAGALAVFGIDTADGIPTRETMEDRSAALQQLTSHLQKLSNEEAVQKSAEAATRFGLESRITIGLVLAMILLAVGVSLRIVWGTSRVLGKLADELHEMASADGQIAEGNEVSGMQQAVMRLKASLLEKETLSTEMRTRDAEMAQALRRERQREAEERKRLEEERESERVTAAANAERAASVAQFQADLEQTVDAAVCGDFSRRLGTKGEQKDLAAIAERMNTLMVSVETAVSETSQVLMDLAAGDLSARIHGNYQGVFADLKRDTNATAAQLSQVVAAIDQTVVRINQSLTQIVSGSDTLSKRTASQAANLETVAASISQMTQALSATTKSAADAQQLSLGTSEQAEKGDQVANETFGSIQAIEDSARKIDKFTSAVEDIAFQTNILALNASVEAARAGQAGKGFAVVAHEVRELAQRANRAASEIKVLVEDSMVQVTTGSSKVTATRDQLSDIRSGIQTFANAIQTISASCQDQLNGLTTISRTMASLDAETRSNAQLAQQSLEAANDVTAEAAQLSGLMQMFRHGEGSGIGPARRHAA